MIGRVTDAHGALATARQVARARSAEVGDDRHAGDVDDAHLWWRVCIDEVGDARLLADEPAASTALACQVNCDKKLMHVAERARQDQQRVPQAPSQGQGLKYTSRMALADVEKAMQMSDPAHAHQVSADSLSSAQCSRRIFFLSRLTDKKWLDRDRLASVPHQNAFNTWTDVPNEVLNLSLKERDFIRHMAIDHTHILPQGHDRCPCCGTSSAVLSGRARHLIYECAAAVAVRDALIIRAAPQTDSALLTEAWVWRLRPPKPSEAATVVGRRRAAAIRIATKGQMAFRKAVWARFEIKEGEEGFPSWPQSAEELAEWIAEVAGLVSLV